MENTDRIEKRVLLRAPLRRVWQAIADSDQFGSWFGVRFDAPFAAGSRMSGRIVPTTVDPQVAAAQKAYEGKAFEFVVERIEPMRLFSLRWHPYAVDPTVDYSKEESTLVEFRLKETPEGILLTVTESGIRSCADRAPRQGVRDERTGLGRTVDAHREVSRTRTTAVNRLRSANSRVAGRADAARIFAALGDPTRLYIVARLGKEGPMPIVRLASMASVSRQAITKHLNALARAGLARASRSGRERIWELRHEGISEIKVYLDRISRDWDAALHRLRALVEK